MLSGASRDRPVIVGWSTLRRADCVRNDQSVPTCSTGLLRPSDHFLPGSCCQLSMLTRNPKHPKPQAGPAVSAPGSAYPYPSLCRPKSLDFGMGHSGLSCMRSSRRSPFGYIANADTVLIARKERNACTNERVADGRKNSIPRLDSPFQVISNG